MSELLHETLNLFFPQWQGSGKFDLYQGAKLLYESLHDRISFTEISTSLTYSLTIDESILGYSQIFSQLLEACRVIQAHNPERILTVGGDCGVEIAPVSFLNKRYDEALAVLWLDAHGDLNTPSSSPSSHFHGMPLRVLLGEGNTDIVEQAFSTLRSNQVFLIGSRDFDSPERSFIQQSDLSVFSAKVINDGEHEPLFSTLEKAGFNKLYIHLDLDVIEPEEFPDVACPTPGGIHIDRLKNLLVCLRESFDIVGFSVLEFLPTNLKKSAALEVVKLLESVNLMSLSVT
ncbi:arginase family protein [Microcoleus sp. FACHB-SPT15]|uniref:arginase family protein n=1 Tax=Microcoleus sp. FACHB-SPT15 TaxID=2692830 RepID=UPI00177F6E50|nr:arginase family protein [Microcoleus sp. FACHB-SPT15]MBD1805576.1 arginase family protein [Microcoleus sp. FACHB-SPT15]